MRVAGIADREILRARTQRRPPPGVHWRCGRIQTERGPAERGREMQRSCARGDDTVDSRKQRNELPEVQPTHEIHRVRWKGLEPRIERGDFRIWDDGKPVAYAGYNDAAPDFARIAPVYTLPECRGMGYATSLVAAHSSAVS